MTSTSNNSTKFANTVVLLNASAADLEKISKQGMLSLTLEEMKTIQQHFEKLQRNPTDIELETIAQTWSEHCVHKTFKANYVYTEENIGTGKSLVTDGQKTYKNLLKETIVKATEQLNHPWCLSVFKDNAGIIEFDQEDAISFKVETHNHPSALEPYGGAATGLGGVIRDVLGCGLGGKPVLNTDVFCFGPLDTQEADIPKGALSPKRIAHGVVSGVRDYGNRMGIPTANGAIYFDKGYVGNPLVFCGTVGLQPKTTIDKTVHPEDLVVAMGGRTGRDGIHGATFSSAPLESGISSSVVQLGHAINEKKVLDVLLQARNKKLYRSITDCGAGGFSSAIGELGSETGVTINLEKAPLKYPGLQPWEIWISESQERMVLAVPPENWNSLRTLCELEDVEAVVIGKFTNDKKLTVMYNTDVIADIDMQFLHDGILKLQLKGVWNPTEFAQRHNVTSTVPATTDISTILKSLLRHPIIASKESVVKQYDHEVQGGAIIKPFMGAHHDGPSDAAVYRPKLSSWKGFVVSNGMNPEIGKWDPYIMAKWAIDEAYRNLLAIGGTLSHAAILDNFCWGDAKDPLQLAGLVRASEGCLEAALAYQLPFISGKDSFNNTWKSPDGKLQSIPPTLLVSAIGVINDVRECLSSGIKAENNLLYVVGETKLDLKASLASQVGAPSTGEIIDVDLNESKVIYKKLQTAMKHRTILSCHDCSEGGIAVAASEMSFGGTVGVELHPLVSETDLLAYLFSETPSRFVVEVSASRKAEFEQLMGQTGATLIGKTIKTPQFIVSVNNKVHVKENIDSLKSLWKKSLESL